MDLQISFLDTPEVIEPLKVIKQIGASKFEVFQVYSPTQDKYFAFKAYPKTIECKELYNKEALMHRLSHPNIVKSFAVHLHDNRDFLAIMTEYLERQDFFDVTSSGILTDEIVARTYFYQLIDAVEYMHGEGIAHLDLKLDNLMLGDNYELKIIDFDQAQRLLDLPLTAGGSPGYRAPEVLSQQCEDFAAVDIYCSGIILYAFLTKEFPFPEMGSSPSRSKSSFEAYVQDKSLFWERKATRRKNPIELSEDFLELIDGMIHEDAKKRFTIKDIKNSKWFNGPVMDDDVLKSYMKTKMAKLTTMEEE